jgi:hypothetical protein
MRGIRQQSVAYLPFSLEPRRTVAFLSGERELRAQSGTRLLRELDVQEPGGQRRGAALSRDVRWIDGLGRCRASHLRIPSVA